jgi:hypothetical protein
LIWEQNPDATQKDWYTALTYANDSTLVGYDDWGLPNFYESATLLHAGETTLATWLNANGFSNVFPSSYWTGTTNDIVGTDFILVILTSNGTSISLGGIVEPTADRRALIVRGTAEGE